MRPEGRNQTKDVSELFQTFNPPNLLTSPKVAPVALFRRCFRNLFHRGTLCHIELHDFRNAKMQLNANGVDTYLVLLFPFAGLRRVGNFYRQRRCSDCERGTKRQQQDFRESPIVAGLGRGGIASVRLCDVQDLQSERSRSHLAHDATNQLSLP